MIPLLQICLWVKGQSCHDFASGRHCPDLSCCRPDLLAPREERELFLEAFMMGDQKLVERLMVMFGGRAIKHPAPTRPDQGK